MLTNIDNELYCYSNEFHSHLPFDRLYAYPKLTHWTTIRLTRNLFFLLVYFFYLSTFGEALQLNGLTKKLTMSLVNPVNPLSRNAPQCGLLIFFTCLTPDDFTNVNGEAVQLNGLTAFNQKCLLTMSLVTHWTAMRLSAPYFFLLV